MVNSLHDLRRGSCWVLLMVLASQTLADQLTAREWLDRMSHSFRELNYRGSFSYQRGDRIKSFRIQHAVIDGQEFERLDYLDGEQRNVVRKGHNLDCVHPGHKRIRFGLPAGVDSAQQAHMDGVEQNYQLSLGERDRLAGRNVIKLHVAPRDSYRYGYRLALDEETALPVRSELLGQDGKVLERFQFVELETGIAIERSVFDEAPRETKAVHGAAPRQQAAAMPERWRPDWVPQGFSSATTTGSADQSRDMVTFTDGLAVFSVFLERVEQAVEAADISTSRGATSAYSRALQLSQNPYRVTVVGEIPQQTAQRVAQSVSLSAR